MKALAIAGVNLRRLFRDRGNIFFVLLFPLLLILVIGTAFGGSFTPRLGVVAPDGEPLADQLVAALEADERIEVDQFDGEHEMRTAVERGSLAGGLVIPPGYDAGVRDAVVRDAAEPFAVRYLARPDEFGQQVRLAVNAVVAEQAARLRAAGFAAGATGTSFDAALDTADATAPLVPTVSVRATTVGEAVFPEGLGRFDIGASSQLLLFVFLTSLVGATALIETRRYGVSRRMLATPTSSRTILFGEALGRIAVALTQGLIIMLGAAVLFGVDWGDPLGAAAVLAVFALVASGAAMVLGALLRTEQQAGGVGIMVGLGLAALGGSMLPIELFSDTMRTVAHATPHAWANEAFAELVRHGGSVLDIAPQLAILAGYAAALFLLGSWLLRRTLTH